MTSHSAAARTPCDAIILLPGLVPEAGTNLNAVSRRLAVALDNSAPSPVSFSIGAARTVTFADREVRAISILRRDQTAAEPQPIVDVFEFDYRAYLTGGLGQASPLRQALAVAMTLALNTLGLFGAMRRPTQRLSQKLQVCCGAMLFGVLLVYLVMLVVAVFGSLVPVAAEAAQAKLATTWLGAHVASAVTALPMLKTAIAFLALAGFTTQASLKKTLSTLAPTLACTSDYLSAGKHRNQIIGELTRLIDHLDEQNQVVYRRVHLLTYSFGSVIALDALFPREHSVGRKLERVDTLVTIGCPLNFIRTYWPRYFRSRHAAPDVPQRWINIYCELDIFGSNFFETIPSGVTRRPLPTDNLPFGPTSEDSGSFWEYARFIGFRIHSVYWDRDSENALSCFELVIQKLYAQELSLSVPAERARSSTAIGW